jgi:hypothetical protein
MVVAVIASLIGLVLLVPVAHAQGGDDQYCGVACPGEGDGGSGGSDDFGVGGSGGGGSGGRRSSDDNDDERERTVRRVRDVVHHHHVSRDDEDNERDAPQTVVRNVRSVPSGGVETAGGGALPGNGQGMSATAAVLGSSVAVALIGGGLLGLRRGRAT